MCDICDRELFPKNALLKVLQKEYVPKLYEFTKASLNMFVL